MAYLLGSCISYFQSKKIHVLSNTEPKTSRYIAALETDIKLYKFFVDLAR